MMDAQIGIIKCFIWDSDTVDFIDVVSHEFGHVCGFMILIEMMLQASKENQWQYHFDSIYHKKSNVIRLD